MSIAKQVFEWIETYPYLKWGLKNKLINYSSLARKIQKELKIKNFDAILIALRRYQDSLKFVEEEKITKILKESRLEIKTKINVYIIKNLDLSLLKGLERFHLISSKDVYSLITEKKLKLRTIKSYEDVIEVSVKSPLAIEEVPGIVAIICSALAESGINILEMYSVWSDSIFIFDKKDLARVVSCLEKIGIK